MPELRPRFVVILLTCAFIALADSNQTTPYWAYCINPDKPASSRAKQDENAAQHVPNSGASFTSKQIGDLFSVPDWHPSGHPAMPDVVAHGRKPDVYACGYCHLPNGMGRPENASLAGLPAGYIERQLADFKSGARKSSEPRHLPAVNMQRIGASAADQDVTVAAQYFASLKRQPWIRVVEAATVPTTHVAGWMLVANMPASTEAIGQRIIEMPENLERTELRDDTSGFVAYVPPGSLQKGRSLVTTGDGGKTQYCAKCHGPGLRGSGNVPPIAGRSPSYIIRQMYDIKSGARAGVLSKQMSPVVAKLQIDDMISIAAFVASLRP